MNTLPLFQPKQLFLHLLTSHNNMNTKAFTHQLLIWYQTHKRNLPWRNTHNPYLILVSETMLQQTRVEQAINYYTRFIQRFPDAHTLAQASEDEVLKLWQGLGYYSRARNLLKAAQQISAAGTFPTTYNSIRQLKGVGPYTAAAVASLAFNLPYAVVDGNVLRVLARHFGINSPIDATNGKKHFATLAQQLLPTQQAADFNQAIMDFGALQCIPLSPHCHSCPMAKTCAALSTGQVKELPVKARTTRITQRHFHFIYIEAEHKTALFRRESNDIWKGLYEPLLIETESPCTLLSTTQFHDAIHLKTPPSPLTLLAENVPHRLTHRLLLCNFYKLTLTEKPDFPCRTPVWISPKEISAYALPTIIDKMLKTLGLA